MVQLNTFQGGVGGGTLAGLCAQEKTASVSGASPRQFVPVGLVGRALEPTTVATLWTRKEAELDAGAEQPARPPTPRDERLHLGTTVAHRGTVFAQLDLPRSV